MEKAKPNRGVPLVAKFWSVGKTQMNEKSSRSHFVFTLRIFGVDKSTDRQVQGVLNLIDLAGSESLSKSGSTGDRLKETQAINKILSSLSDVVFALGRRTNMYHLGTQSLHIFFRCNARIIYSWWRMSAFIGCDLVIFSGNTIEKPASGVLHPFISHFNFARDKISKGGYLITI